jgi:hypothetical protein
VADGIAAGGERADHELDRVVHGGG